MMSSEILKSLEGKTIRTVTPQENEEKDVFCVTIECEDGTSIKLYPTTYNYGVQHLVVEQE